jgi:hypothetical protein
VEILERDDWEQRAAEHAARVDRWIQPHLARRQSGVKHPVHDFLFTYYSQSPTALRRWHPGYGVVLVGADAEPLGPQHLAAKVPLVEGIRRLLAATEGRTASYGCFGLHEWAMVHGQPESDTRHDWPLRLGAAGTDTVVESHRIACSHFDAFRFFTDSARPLNTLSPGRDDRPSFEQPGCLHAGMDLYKHAFRLSPLVPSELVADCFELAWDIRELDMRASPYDFSDLGYEPVAIETPEGKQQYVAAQRVFAERGAPLRRRLVEECDRLLARAAELRASGAPANG